MFSVVSIIFMEESLSSFSREALSYLTDSDPLFGRPSNCRFLDPVSYGGYYVLCILMLRPRLEACFADNASWRADFPRKAESFAWRWSEAVFLSYIKIANPSIHSLSSCLDLALNTSCLLGISIVNVCFKLCFYSSKSRSSIALGLNPESPWKTFRILCSSSTRKDCPGKLAYLKVIKVRFSSQNLTLKDFTTNIEYWPWSFDRCPDTIGYFII